MKTNFISISLVYLYLIAEVFAQINIRDKEKSLYHGSRPKVIENYVMDDKNDHKDDENDEEFYPDDYIERPCPVYDRFCIRGFFSQHSKCKIASGPVPDPFYLAQVPVYMSSSNVTTTVIDNYITGLSSGRIEAFYINRKTRKLVLAIYFPKVNAKVSQTFFQFYRNGAEPVERIAPADQLYEGLAATVVFPNFNDLKLEESEITAYLENGLSPFALGLNALRDRDPAVIAGVSALVSDLPFSLRQLLLTVIKPFASAWIQYNICNFGAPINTIGF